MYEDGIRLLKAHSYPTTQKRLACIINRSDGKVRKI
jgi:hypothetical protein